MSGRAVFYLFQTNHFPTLFIENCFLNTVVNIFTYIYKYIKTVTSFARTIRAFCLTISIFLLHYIFDITFHQNIFKKKIEFFAKKMQSLAFNAHNDYTSKLYYNEKK